MVLKGQSVEEEEEDWGEQKQDPFPPPHTEQINGIKGTIGGGGGGGGLGGAEAGPVSTTAH
jgi:hypothetical protein